MIRRRPARSFAVIAQLAQEALIGCAIAGVLAGATATISYISTMQLGPEVGDLIRLQARNGIATDWQIPARNVRTHRACSLQPAAMADPGGSLVVARRSADGWTFEVLWTGTRTSAGPDNCGKAAELEITEPALWSLAQIGDATAPWHIAGF